MRLMQEDALSKLMNGMTTLEEILRVILVETARDVECPKCFQNILPTFKFCPSCGTRCARETSDRMSHKRELIPEEVV